MYIDDIFNESNNPYHRTIKMKSNDVKSSTYVDFGVENNEKDPKFVVGDHVRKLKYKNIFAKCYTPIWSEEAIKKVKSTDLWTYVIVDLNGEEIAGKFYEKNCKRQIKIDFRVEKVIKRKGVM